MSVLTGRPAAQNTSPPRHTLSIVVPTYMEAENIPLLIERLDGVRSTAGLDFEVFIMDDSSPDTTPDAVARCGLDWVKLVVRTSNRGLSPAVVEGLKLSTRDVLLVMDADLSHPPERIPEMLAALEAGADFVIGSRYVPGASTDEHWGMFRWINSKVATILARPFTRAKDPMSGFFMLRRETLARAKELNPIGYKIGLELLVKCGCTNIVEVPIHFADRRLGQSKLNLREQLRYIRHVWRLLCYKFLGGR
jgi:dolichol-phosphate mannosyltransferase